MNNIIDQNLEKKKKGEVFFPLQKKYIKKNDGVKKKTKFIYILWCVCRNGKYAPVEKNVYHEC